MNGWTQTSNAKSFNDLPALEPPRLTYPRLAAGTLLVVEGNVEGCDRYRVAVATSGRYVEVEPLHTPGKTTHLKRGEFVLAGAAQ